MSYLDDFLAGRILNSSSNNNGRDDSSELKRGLLNEKLARQNAEASKRDAERTSKLLLDSSKSTIDSLREDYEDMRKAREKFRSALNLERQEKKALLSKPLYEAVKENEDWDLAYDKLTSSLAYSYVMKEAYKELAIKYGGELGVSRSEIINSVNGTAEEVFTERIKKIDQMLNDPTIKDDYVLPKTMLPRDRIERMIKVLKS